MTVDGWIAIVGIAAANVVALMGFSLKIRSDISAALTEIKSTRRDIDRIDGELRDLRMER